ncbi:F-box domain containing protein [Pandoravirus salinus]|uniref:F-box domain containing protein n=1 Tax=Pandoravirus salinus TaxID=1349410 RepID=S4W226_9VIRU|nr:F-box domain [Pandoravirus salinus]AGO84472.1 F-box domain containing protein [Pandoravirus salinus]
MSHIALTDSGCADNMPVGSVPFDTLPDEILAVLFALLDCRDSAVSVAPTCRRWRCVATDAAAIGRRRCTTISLAKNGPAGYRERGTGKPAAGDLLLCLRAIRADHPACLLRSRRPDCQWDHRLWSAIAFCDSVTCARAMCLVGSPPRCSDFTEAAAWGGHVSSIERLRDLGCPCNIDRILGIAVDEGRVECAAYALRHGGVLYEGAGWWCGMAPAAPENHAACLRGLLEAGHTFDGNVCMTAATDHADCLRILHEAGYPWDTDVTEMAAHWGAFGCLSYAHEHGCPWDSTTCTVAASQGHLGCLEYAHENGCAWDERTWQAAVDGAHTECIAYLRDHDCPGSQAIDDLHGTRPAQSQR